MSIDLERAVERLARVLTTTTTGTRSHPRTLTILELALEHAEAWADTEAPREGERGGTSNPVSDDEAAEIRRVHRLAIDATGRVQELAEALDWKTARLERLAAYTLVRLKKLAKQVDADASELDALVQRLTATVDPSKLPRPAMPRCASCARTEGTGSQRIGDHYAEVYERAPTTGLCRFCYDYDTANECWPPVKACHLYHTQSRKAAGVYLAKLAAA